MNTNQILTALGVVVAIAAVFVGQVAAYSALILVALGLVSGFMSPMADAASRMAYTVAAVAMPTLANSLDVIPAVGNLTGITFIGEPVKLTDSQSNDYQTN